MRRARSRKVVPIINKENILNNFFNKTGTNFSRKVNGVNLLIMSRFLNIFDFAGFLMLLKSMIYYVMQKPAIILYESFNE